MQIEINLEKLERGIREGRVKVTRGGKTFWRKQRLGRQTVDIEGISMQIEAEEDYTGKLYQSTSVANAESIEKEGFQDTGKLSDNPTPEQKLHPWFKYGFISFNNNLDEIKRPGEVTFEIDVKNLRVAGGAEYAKVLSKYQDIWMNKIDAIIDDKGFSDPEVKILNSEREGKTTTMTDLVTKEFNEKYDGMIGMPGEIVVTNPDIIKNIKRIK